MSTPRNNRQQLYPVYHVRGGGGRRVLCGNSRAKVAVSRDEALRVGDHLCRRCENAILSFPAANTERGTTNFGDDGHEG